MDFDDAPYPETAGGSVYLKATQDRVVLEIHAGLYPWLPVLSGRACSIVRHARRAVSESEAAAPTRC